jgi:hypothetical protein
VPAAHAPAARAPAARAAASSGDSSIGLAGIRLTRDEAFSLVRDAVAALVTGDDAVPSERVRQKAFALLGRDSESLSERNFARILRDAHDADIVDLRKRGDAFEVAAAASAPSVADQLEVKEAALQAAAAKEKAANTVAVPRGMGHRGAPARGGRGGFGAGKAASPGSLLLLGVVDDTPSVSTRQAPATAGASAAADAVEGAPGAKASRRPRGRGKNAENTAGMDGGESAPKAPRTRVPRAKKAGTTA